MVFAVQLNDETLKKLSKICKENADATDNKEFFLLNKKEMEESETNKKITEKINSVSQRIFYS